MEKLSYQLPNFEGPLDLLLHLIAKNKLDIRELPVALLLEQYLEPVSYTHLDVYKRQMLSQAQLKSREMRKAANDYADDLMKRTDEALTANLQELRQARQALRTPPKKGEE